MSEYPKILENVVNELSSLPGVGKKTALRYALFLLNNSEEENQSFIKAITKLKTDLKICSECFNISDEVICHICNQEHRDKSTICVVEDIRDVVAIEKTHQFKGVYHVLGGVISPIDGIGPSELKIKELITRAEKNNVQEIILALSTTMEGDTTNFYLYKKLSHLTNSKVTTLARGLSIGNELEYTDEITLGRSIVNRHLYENSLVK